MFDPILELIHTSYTDSQFFFLYSCLTLIITICFINSCHRHTEPNKEVCEECHNQIGIESFPDKVTNEGCELIPKFMKSDYF